VSTHTHPHTFCIGIRKDYFSSHRKSILLFQNEVPSLLKCKSSTNYVQRESILINTKIALWPRNPYDIVWVQRARVMSADQIRALRLHGVSKVVYLFIIPSNVMKKVSCYHKDSVSNSLYTFKVNGVPLRHLYY